MKQRRRNKLVVEHDISLEAYTLFQNIYSNWKQSGTSFLLPQPLKYDESTATLERTWMKGRAPSVLYFLTPEPLSKIIYRLKPSVYVEKSAEFLAWLHNLNVKFKHPKLTALREEHTEKMEKIVDDCLKDGLIQEDVADCLINEIRKLSGQEDWGPVSAIHGDFKTQNVLITGKDVAIIDFDMMRHDFSYLDLARFIYNIKLRSNKYLLPWENRINHLNTVFLNVYQEFHGNISRAALTTCCFRALLDELKTVYISSFTKARGLRQSLSFFLNRRNFNYIIKELMSLERVENVRKS